jgi:hypothetical protein
MNTLIAIRFSYNWGFSITGWETVTIPKDIAAWISFNECWLHIMDSTAADLVSPVTLTEHNIRTKKKEGGRDPANYSYDIQVGKRRNG